MMVPDDIKPAHQGLDAWFMPPRIWLGGDDIFAEGVLEYPAEWMDRFASQEETKRICVKWHAGVSL